MTYQTFFIFAEQGVLLLSPCPSSPMGTSPNAPEITPLPSPPNPASELTSTDYKPRTDSLHDASLPSSPLQLTPSPPLSPRVIETELITPTKKVIYLFQ